MRKMHPALHLITEILMQSVGAEPDAVEIYCEWRRSHAICKIYPIQHLIAEILMQSAGAEPDAVEIYC